MSTTSADFDNFSEDDELWLSDLETRAIDLEQELSVWREVRQRSLAEDDYDPEPAAAPPHESFRRAASTPREIAIPMPRVFMWRTILPALRGAIAKRMSL